MDSVPHEEENSGIPPFLLLLFLLLAVIFGSLVGSAIVYAIGTAKDIDVLQLMNSVNEDSPLETRNFIRLANLISHFLTFTVPVIALALFLFREQWTHYLRLERLPRLSIAGLSILFILAAFPLAQIIYWINQKLPIPEWAHRLEDSASGMLKSLLVMDSPAELLFNLLVVAVIPAIGEELLFRGVVQQNLQSWTQKPHLAVWATAFVFSAIHLQFAGFFPRMILGAALGYLFLWTRNLWVPILAHFVFNGSQIVGHYISAGEMDTLNPEEVQDPQWGAFIIGVAVITGAGYYIWLLSKKEESAFPPGN